MSELTERFCAEHFTLDSISERRREQVRTALARYESFSSKPAEQCDANELRSWLVSLLDGGLAPSTVGWHLKMVKPFYRWLWQQRLLSADELMRVREVRAPRGGQAQLPRPYKQKELLKMYAQLEARFPLLPPEGKGSTMLRRFRGGYSRFHGPLRAHAMRLQLEAIIELALVCGLRRIEIYRLAVDDCHPDNKYIVVHGKRTDQNPKVREVPYPESTRRAIQAWFRMRAVMEPEPGIGLWLSITGPVPAAELSFERMATVLRSFGRWELHRLRHTCATERLRAGMELQSLREFLGHSDINMTLRYAQLLRDDIHKAAAKTEADFQAAIGRAA